MTNDEKLTELLVRAEQGTKEQNIIASGECGEKLTWTLDASGTLTISGTGEMKSYVVDFTPWDNYVNNVKNIVIESGVTSIGDWAFLRCSSLASVTIPDSVTSIGDKAFYGCSSLASVTIPDSVTFIGNGAFDGIANGAIISPREDRAAPQELRLSMKDRFAAAQAKADQQNVEHTKENAGRVAPAPREAPGAD